MIATIRPKAVQFIASEMPSARILAFWLGSTLSPDTAPKLTMRPDTVPRRPESIERFARSAREPLRLGTPRPLRPPPPPPGGGAPGAGPRLHDARERRIGGRAHLDGLGDVAGQ